MPGIVALISFNFFVSENKNTKLNPILNNSLLACLNLATFNIIQ